MGIIGKAAAGLVIAFIALALASMLLPSEAELGRADIGAGIGAELERISFSRITPLDYGSGSAVLVPVDSGGAEGARVEIVAMDTPAPSKAAWWGGNGSAGASSSPKLENALAGKLKEVSGWKFATVSNSSELGKYDYVVVANGAWPVEILREIRDKTIPAKGRAIIYFGLMDGSAIGEGGRIVRADEMPEWMIGDGNGTQKSFSGGGAQARRIAAPSGGEIWIVPRAPDEISDFSQLAEEIAIGMAEAPQADGTRGTYRLHGGRNNLIVENTGAETWLNILVYANNTLRKEISAGPIRRLAGNIRGAKEAQIGAPSPYQVTISPALPQDEKLEYYAVARAENGSEAGRKKIGAGNTRERWAGAFTYDEWPQEGDAVLSVEDQFGRTWARAFVRLPKYQVKITWERGAEKEFSVMKDGAPYEGEAQVKINGAEDARRIFIGNGKALVAGSWKAGKNAVEFYIGGKKERVEWNEEGGVSSALIRYGLPGIALAAVIYVALRPRKKPAYKIIFGSGRNVNVEEIRMTKEEIADAVGKAAKGRAATAREVWNEIGKRRKLAGMSLPLENVEVALEKLARSGAISGWRGHYAPHRRGNGGEEMRAIAMSRMIYDALVESGISAEEKQNGEWHEKGDGRRRFVAYDGKMPNLGGGGKFFLIFEDEDEMRTVEKRLAQGGREGAAAWLAIHSGKLKMTTIGKLRGELN